MGEIMKFQKSYIVITLVFLLTLLVIACNVAGTPAGLPGGQGVDSDLSEYCTRSEIEELLADLSNSNIANDAGICQTKIDGGQYGFLRYDNALGDVSIDGTLKVESLIVAGSPVITAGSTSWNSSTEDLYYLDGNVGIGTSDPAEKLSVDGNVSISGDLSLSGSICTDLAISAKGGFSTGEQSIKWKVFTGKTTNTNYTEIIHGISSLSSIIAIEPVVEINNMAIPDNYAASTNYQYSIYANTQKIVLTHSQSIIKNRNYRIILFYL
jgi:hypothetical protein